MPYQLTRGAEIRRLDNGAMIPPDPGNVDYQEYLRWLAAGNTPQPADPAPVPAPVLPTPYEWFGRLSLQTRLNVAVAKRTDAMLDLLLTQGAGAREIDVNAPETKATVGYLLNAGLITVDESQLLLSP